mgnify:FL=1
MHYPDNVIISKLCSEALPEEREALLQIREQSFEMICIWVCKNQGKCADAKDIYQEVITNLVQKIRSGKFVQSATLKTYNFSVARNLWYKELRKRKRNTPLDTLNQTFECSTNIEQDVIRREREASIHKHLDRLPQKQANVLRLYYFDRKKMSEIASILGFKNEQVAKNLKCKAMKKLKELMC